MLELLWDRFPSALVHRFLHSQPAMKTNGCIQVFRKLRGGYHLHVTILDS